MRHNPICRRGGIILYENELKNGKWQNEPLARTIIEQERSRLWSYEEHLEYAEAFDALLEALKKHNRQASTVEIQYMESLREKAYQHLASEHEKPTPAPEI